MRNVNELRGRIARAPGVVPWLLIGLYCVGPMSASAMCMVSQNPDFQELQSLVAADAARALRQIQGRLDELGHGKTNGSTPPASTESPKSVSAQPSSHVLAELYGLQAQAFEILERAADAREAASLGLALVPDLRDPIHSLLLSAFAENVYEGGAISDALQRVEASRHQLEQNSVGDICLLVSRGVLEHRQNRAELAIVSLTQAYRETIAATVTQAHVAAAAALSPVMRSLGDYTQALALNEEEIDWDTAHGATLSLSVSRFMRGKILRAMGNNRDAIDEFTQSRRLSIALDDEEGVAYADLRICNAHIELHALNTAQRECANAKRIFSAAQDFDSVKETESLQARLELEQGRPQSSLLMLNSILEFHGSDLAPYMLAPMYELRAKANAALGNHQEAFADLSEYVRRSTALNDAERLRQTVALRARFEIDREIERNASLKRELAASQEQSGRQARELRLNEIVAVTGACIIALLMYFLAANYRYRRQLIRLANQDGLTGLPNRRRIAELATTNLQAARQSGRTLTIGVIDMDHFKVINDCCGHAAGDFVLKEFARASREALRPVDLLGRWGGEEFLLIMPDASLEVAAANLQRLRTLVSAIRLPPAAIGLKVSLSAGLAIFDDSVASLDELIARADGALYTAKDKGRDCVEIADSTQRTGSHAIRRLQRQ